MYLDDAREIAVDAVREYQEDILKAIMKGKKYTLNADVPINQCSIYTWINEKSEIFPDLQEAAAILEELARFKETDSGIWQGLEPREAIISQAVSTFTNAVCAMTAALLAYIHEHFEDRLDDLVKDLITEWRQE